LVQIDENYFGYWLLIIFVNHVCIPHIIYMCIRVAAAAEEEVVYEVVAEPQEPLEQAQQVERHENQAQGPVDPGVEQQSQGKPGACPIISIYESPYVFITYALRFRSCLKP
jgi:hypothetical protein